MRGYHVEVIDLGLHLDEALALGLLTEEFTRERALPEGLELTELERQHFEGKPAGRNRWICQRVELNAFSAPDLIAFIERKLQEAGAVGKVVPSEAALPALLSQLTNQAVADWVSEEVWQLLDLGTLQRQLAEQLLAGIAPADARAGLLADLRAQDQRSWREVWGARLHTRLDDESEALRQAVRASLRKAVV